MSFPDDMGEMKNRRVAPMTRGPSWWPAITVKGHQFLDGAETYFDPIEPPAPETPMFKANVLDNTAVPLTEDILSRAIVPPCSHPPEKAIWQAWLGARGIGLAAPNDNYGLAHECQCGMYRYTAGGLAWTEWRESGAEDCGNLDSPRLKDWPHGRMTDSVDDSGRPGTRWVHVDAVHVGYSRRAIEEIFEDYGEANALTHSTQGAVAGAPPKPGPPPATTYSREFGGRIYEFAVPAPAVPVNPPPAHEQMETEGDRRGGPMTWQPEQPTTLDERIAHVGCEFYCDFDGTTQTYGEYAEATRKLVHRADSPPWALVRPQASSKARYSRWWAARQGKV